MTEKRERERGSEKEKKTTINERKREKRGNIIIDWFYLISRKKKSA
jgi:hypothetical protein